MNKSVWRGRGTGRGEEVKIKKRETPQMDLFTFLPSTTLHSRLAAVCSLPSVHSPHLEIHSLVPFASPRRIPTNSLFLFAICPAYRCFPHDLPHHPIQSKANRGPETGQPNKKDALSSTSQPIPANAGRQWILRWPVHGTSTLK